jgi:hypothetical protein
MTNSELSLEFNILYNNIMSLQAPGFDDYEKSVLLTKAQEDVLKNYFNPKGNKYKEGYSDSIKRDTDFSNIIKVINIKGSYLEDSFYNNTLAFERPSDLFLPISYKLRSSKGGDIIVKPLKDIELERLFSKPYKEPFKGYAYKIDNSSNKNIFEIIVRSSDYKNEQILYLRYLRKPRPIILTDFDKLEEELGLPLGTYSINGETKYSESEFANNDSLCREILDRAVNLGKIHYESSTENIIQYSNNNE